MLLDRGNTPEGHECCGEPLQRDVHHPKSRKTGGSHLRTHTSLVRAVATLCERSGAYVDGERYIPELYRETGGRPLQHEVERAIMDVVVHYPGETEAAWLDITVRNPQATRYRTVQPRAANAASTAALEKIERYGRAVGVLNFESYGRLGKEGQITLDRLAASATLLKRSSQFVVARWRAKLEATLLFGIADANLRAFGANDRNGVVVGPII